MLKVDSSSKLCFEEGIVKSMVSNKCIFKVFRHEEFQMQALVTLLSSASSETLQQIDKTHHSLQKFKER